MRRMEEDIIRERVKVDNNNVNISNYGGIVRGKEGGKRGCMKGDFLNGCDSF